MKVSIEIKEKPFVTAEYPQTSHGRAEYELAVIDHTLMQTDRLAEKLYADRTELERQQRMLKRIVDAEPGGIGGMTPDELETELEEQDD